MICLIKCVTVFTACHLCSLLLTLLITCLVSDHVVTTCHFLLSKRFCLKSFIMREHWLLFIYSLCHFIAKCVCVCVCVILLVLCSCNSVRMSFKLIKGNLLTYLLICKLNTKYCIMHDLTRCKNFECYLAILWGVNSLENEDIPPIVGLSKRIIYVIIPMTIV